MGNPGALSVCTGHSPGRQPVRFDLIDNLEGSIYRRTDKAAKYSCILDQEFQAKGFNYRKIHQNLYD